MALWLISRHPGACEWIRRQGISVDVVRDRLDLLALSPGDEVIGALPVHLAAAVCRRGVRYYHLAIDVPHHWRGRELSHDAMIACGARLERYQITRSPASLEGGDAACDHRSATTETTAGKLQTNPAKGDDQ